MLRRRGITVESSAQDLQIAGSSPRFGGRILLRISLEQAELLSSTPFVSAVFRWPKTIVAHVLRAWANSARYLKLRVGE